MVCLDALGGEHSQHSQLLPALAAEQEVLNREFTLQPGFGRTVDPLAQCPAKRVASVRRIRRKFHRRVDEGEDTLASLQ